MKANRTTRQSRTRRTAPGSSSLQIRWPRFRPRVRCPGPESSGVVPMTPAQRDAIYGNSPNAPQRTSNASQANAEAKQRVLAREKLHQDALSSDTVAIDFAHPSGAEARATPPAGMTAMEADRASATDTAQGTDLAASAETQRPGNLQNLSDKSGAPGAKTNPMAGL